MKPVVHAPRVVLIPGVLGSELVDGSMTPAEARRLCEGNLGVLGRVMRGSALYPCDKRPELLWGGVGSLHWLFNPESWGARMRSGNGFDVAGHVRPGGLFDVDVRLGRRRLAFQPYASLLRALRRAGADVLVFPYDWRLSLTHTASLLQQRILERWYGGPEHRDVGSVSEADRITFIGHSMGGLLARYFVESPRRNGWRVLQQLITIGTPHLGAPEAYLHFTGRSFPFPENPFYRAARDAMLQQLALSGVTPPGGLRAQFLPGRVQTEVLRSMASAVELLPVYDFVQDNSQAEPFRTTYQGLVHSGTGRPAMQLLEVFRNGVLRENLLEQWLTGHPGRHYHFLAATSFPTVVGYERRGDRILTRPLGDGRVPLTSARPVSGSAHVHVTTLAAGGLDHQRLCERADVQAYCLRAIREGQRRAGAGTTPLRTAAWPAPQVDDYVAMARTIMARSNVPTRRGVVLSIVRLDAATGPPLVDTTTEPSTNPARLRLKNPPAHLSSREVFEVRSPRSGPFRYVLIHSNEGEAGYPIGGFLFLPTNAERHVYLATFNVGPLDARYPAQCRNGHHAEIQLTRFVEHQPPSWRRQLDSVQIVNRSRRSSLRGYSPCNACCDDLAKFLVALKALRGTARIDASISWLVRYTGSPICGHPTDSRGLALLRASGWRLPDPLPTAVREIATPGRQFAGAR